MDTRAMGARIKTAREAKNMTQEDLAAIIDLSSTHMSVIERGVKAPKLETFVSIANALGVSADTLLLDVVDNATNEQATDISMKLSGLPGKEKKRILKILDTLLEEYERLQKAFLFFCFRQEPPFFRQPIRKNSRKKLWRITLLASPHLMNCALNTIFHQLLLFVIG